MVITGLDDKAKERLQENVQELMMKAVLAQPQIIEPAINEEQSPDPRRASMEFEEQRQEPEVQEYHVEKEPKHVSNSQRFCGCCITGPRDKAKMPIIANTVIFLALAANGASLAYLWPDWKPLTIGNLALGVVSLILMWVVQFSDPGIQSTAKNREAEVHENPGFDVNDTQLSMNPYEKGIWNPE